MSTPVQLEFGTLGQAFCFDGNLDHLGAAIIGATTATLGINFTPFVIGPDQPAAQDQDKPWIKLTSVGGPTDGIYVWVGSYGAQNVNAWVRLHPYQFGSSPILMVPWDVTQPAGAALLAAFDGGDSQPLGPATGPMWQVYTALQAKFPVGAGTTAAPYNTVLTAGGTGGEENHVLTLAQIPAIDLSAFPYPPYAYHGADASGQFDLSSSLPNPGTRSAGYAVSSSIGGGLYHNNMPPYDVVTFITRTSRIFYRGAP